MAGVDTVLEQLGKMTVLELVELKNKIEEEWGVTAAAPVAVAAPGAVAADGRCGRRGEDVVRRRAHRRRSAEDPGDQGRPCRHRSRPQGGQGSRRRCAAGRQRGREPGRGRLDQVPARRGRGERRGQVGNAPTASLVAKGRVRGPSLFRCRAVSPERKPGGILGRSPNSALVACLATGGPFSVPFLVRLLPDTASASPVFPRFFRRALTTSTLREAVFLGPDGHCASRAQIVLTS